MNVLLLVETGLIREPVLYLSRHIIEHKQEYYDRLLAVIANADWEGWLLFMIEGVRHTSEKTLQMIDAIQDLQHEMRGELREVTTAGANADLLYVLFEQPHCRITDVIRQCGVSRPTARKWLDDLASHDILTDQRVGRERLFINHRFLDVLAT